MNTQASADPIALLVENICRLNNGAMEQVRAYIANQPLIVRAQFMGRLAALIESAADVDAAGFGKDEFGDLTPRAIAPLTPLAPVNRL